MSVNFKHIYTNSVVFLIKILLYVCSIILKNLSIMKTLKKTVLTVLMFGTLFSYAKDKIDANFKIDTRKIKIEFTDVKKGNSLFIKDKQGRSLYSENIKTIGNYSKIFNFSSLEKGTYIVELHKKNEIVEKEYYLKNNKITFMKQFIRKINTPTVFVKENKVFLSRLNFDRQELKVSLFYKNELIFTEKLKSNKTTIYRVYKLLKDKKGEYTFVINQRENSFIKNFNI